MSARAARWAIAWAALAGVSLASPSEATVSWGSTWRYLDDGSDPGPTWRDPGFDDSAWASGPAPLGYGRGGEATVIDGGPPTARHVTTFFRHSFSAPDPTPGLPLTLSLQRDDGAVVYLNGSEVARTNLPTGPVDPQTLASSEVTGDDEARVFRFCLPPSALAPGDNLLAIELHQSDPAGADLWLDASLGDAPPALERPPYLQGGTHERMIVRWRTDTCSSTRLRWGAAPDQLDASFEDAALAIDHEVELGGLAAGARYYYEVGTLEAALAGGDADHHFETAPVPGTRRPVRIWALGDSGGCGAEADSCQNAHEVRDAFQSFTGTRPPDLFVMVGDNAYPTGSDDDYTEAVFEVYPEILRRTVLWPAPGNHEFGNADSPTQTGAYYETFTLPRSGEAGGVPSGTEAYYSFDYANIHFVSLDSHDTPRSAPYDPIADLCAPGQGGAMYQWLCADLAATDRDFVIVFWHHPPYSKGSHDSDGCDSGCRLLQMRERFVPVLEHFGVDLQLTGHSHSYERSVLLDGHYQESWTYDPALHAVDAGDGDPAGDGAYQKTALGPLPHDGAVYAVIGSGSRIAAGSFDHPIMVTFSYGLGSLVVDVAGRTLDASFVDETGAVLDRFRIEKGPPLPACDDGLDNDADGEIDAAEDPGCLGDPNAPSEQLATECDDGMDNDADGWVDQGDPGCPHIFGATESPQCQDGIDNDGDGLVDYDGAGVSAPDPNCVDPWSREKAGRACGLGWELAVALGGLLAATRRRSPA